ncbi:MAG: tetratricopeptide repeat protein [Anaerolineales bacterium]|nr:tetratricopeptide repeat protein [Anaerolineales bacterium]
MANAEKVVDYVSSVLSNLIPKPADAVLKPLIKPVGDNLKAWLADKETQKALLKAAEGAESDFREQAKEKFGNDDLTQVVASFPIHNGDLFQAILQSLPLHFNETFLASHISDDLSKYWSGEFSADQIKEAAALYIDCLRVRLLHVNGFADIVTRLAILRTDRRTEDILEIVKEILSLLSELMQKRSKETIFRSLHQLPQPPADFTGREELIEQLTSDFTSHKGATISGLTGMGGIGKTVLGLEVAHKIADNFPDAQIFLDLKGTTTPLSALDIVRHVILSFEPTADLRGLDETNMQGAYQSVLHGKKALLFFDNARSADQIASLRSSETCAMFVTSRWTFSVPGLENRRVDLMGEGEAEDFLFELCPRIGDKAAELAKACSYLPLALRIAGSFLSVNSDWLIEKYLAELNDRKKRLQVLKQSHDDAELTAEPDLLATFELSYNQLSEENQKHWRALGIFPTTFTQKDAKTICSLDETGAIKSLSLFRRYSILDYDEFSRRYKMHDLFVDFAFGKMNEKEFYNVHIMHAFYAVAILREANRLYSLGGNGIFEGLQLFDNEFQQIQSAHRWIVENMSGNRLVTELVMHFTNDGGPCISLRLLPRQRIEWSEVSALAARHLGNRDAEAAEFVALTVAYVDSGDFYKAIEIGEQALNITRKLANPQSIGHALGNLGIAHIELNHVEKAIAYHEESLAIFRKINDLRGQGNALGNLGKAYSHIQEYQKGLDCYKQALVIASQLGDRRMERGASSGIGWASLAMGDPHTAQIHAEDALSIGRVLQDYSGEAEALGILGRVNVALGNPDEGVACFRQQFDAYQKSENGMGQVKALGNIAKTYSEMGISENAIVSWEKQYTIATQINYREGEAEALGNIAREYSIRGNHHMVIKYYEQALVIIREINDVDYECKILGYLGFAYRSVGNPEQAIEKYEQQLVILRKMQDFSEEGYALGDLGSAYYEAGNKEKGIHIMKQALEILEKRELPEASRAREILREWGG